MSESALRERFAGLWKRLGGEGDGSSAFGALLEGYGRPGRHYHNLDHLRDCLARLDEAPANSDVRDLAEAALWYHDVVYLPGAPDNEVRSAEHAAAALREGGVPEDRTREIARLIRLTDHLAPTDDPAGALVCDVDLSVLGRAPAEFAEYERRVRAEYGHVPESLYRAGRARVLTRLLEREPLYRSAHFRARYELPARRNLARALDALGDTAGT